MAGMAEAGGNGGRSTKVMVLSDSFRFFPGDLTSKLVGFLLQLARSFGSVFATSLDSILGKSKSTLLTFKNGQ